MRIAAIVGALVAGLGLGGAGLARADVIDSQPGGFQVEEKVEIAAPADRVWTALGQFGGWWSSEHSWSKDARNLSLDLKAGGCLCETLPGGGGVQHMRVIYAQQGKMAILDGTLGPLMFSGAAGHLVWSLEEKDGHTTLTQDYYVGGYRKGGLGAALAIPVDGVLTLQLGRLKSFVETGKP
ncbi:MAG: SRPBCC family protein [Caulobacterales bacterium]